MSLILLYEDISELQEFQAIKTKFGRMFNYHVISMFQNKDMEIAGDLFQAFEVP